MAEASTIEDVARLAGVSVATVSRALRGLPHVSPGTREKVRLIAHELEYQPNPHAARLAAGRSGTLGIAVPLLNSWFYANVLAGIETVLSEHRLDMHLMTVDSRESIDRFVDSISSLAKRIDGLMICDLFMDDDSWNHLVQSGLPVVTVGVETGLFDSIRIDDRLSGRVAVEHLISRGHTQIGFVGGGEDDIGLPFQSSVLRRLGWLDALQAADLCVGPLLEANGGFTVQGGVEAGNELLRSDNPPTAIFAASDEMAIGVLAALANAGVPVPEAISVVGFDDFTVSKALGLTTMHQSVPEIAAAATRRLLARVGGDRSPIQSDVVETSLEIRATTGPAMTRSDT